MSTKNVSTHYKFNLPSHEDSADVTQLTENWQKLDGLFRALRQAIAITEGTLDSYTDVNMYVYSAGNSQNIANVPEKAQSTLLVLPRLLPDDTANRVQVVITQTNTLYIRNRTGSVWGEWSQFRNVTDIVPIKYGGTEATNVTDARKNLGLPETCVTITNWNEATKTGWYMANNAENAPTNSESGTAWYFGYVIAHNADFVFQEVYQFSISTSAITIPKFIRAKTAGTWGDWYDVTVQRNVPMAAKLDYIKTLTSDAQEQFNNIYKNKMNKNPDCIEITPDDGTNNGGYIDFHFGGSDKDYTSRIIEEAESVLLMRAALKVEGNLYENTGNRVYSTGHKPTPAEIGALPDAVVPIPKGGTGATDVPTARTNLGFIQGSYTGNGSSNARTINIGGIGYALLIWSSTNTMKTIITPEGGTVWYDDGAETTLTEDNSDKKCYFKNGILYLQVKNATLGVPYCDLMNKSGATYYYQVL